MIQLFHLYFCTLSFVTSCSQPASFWPTLEVSIAILITRNQTLREARHVLVLLFVHRLHIVWHANRSETIVPVPGQDRIGLTLPAMINSLVPSTEGSQVRRVVGVASGHGRDSRWCHTSVNQAVFMDRPILTCEEKATLVTLRTLHLGLH